MSQLGSGPEIVHIDRLTRFHGTVPTAWKQILRRENETASEKSASEDEACGSAESAEETRAKNAVVQPANALANANNGDMHGAVNVDTSDTDRDHTDTNVSDVDMTGDLIDFTDGIVELADCDASELFDNGDCVDVTDDSGVGLDDGCIGSSDSCMNGGISPTRIGSLG